MDPHEESPDATGRWDRIDRLFELVRALPEGERPAFLDRACGGDPELHALLTSLLAHAATDDLDLHHIAARVSGLPPTADRHAADDPLIGRTLGRYHIRARLGGGGMGVVYRAWDAGLERPVALKVISPALSRNRAARQRFLTEARAAAAIDHPNICAVHEVGEADDGSPFLAMTYYEGETLTERIARGPLPVPEAIGLIVQVGRAAGAAHGRGIVHRDVKPGNVLITLDGVAKLLDFGVAKFADSSLTMTGAVVGTAAYMSPEQLRGERVDARTDVWSLGVVLYESLAGRPPFRGETEAVTIQAILNEEPPPLSRWRPDVAEPLEAAVCRALAKDRDERYATVDELIHALDPEASFAHTAGTVGAATRPRRIPVASPAWARVGARARRRVGAFALLLLGLLLVGTAVRGWLEASGESGAQLLIVAGNTDPLTREAARELARRLNRWEPAPADVRAGPPPTAGDGGRSPADQALSLAASQRARQLVVVDASAGAGSVRVALDVYDVPSRRPLPSLTATVDAGEWSALDRIVYALLGLEAESGELDRLQRESTRTAAVRALLEGRANLARLEPRQAEARFRQALAVDSTFSAAHHGLALALYWAAAASWSPNQEGASERVGRSTAASVRHARQLPPEDTEHYRAFDAFQRGEYDTARALYHLRIARDSADAYAWLGLGVVETADPWAAPGPDGQLRPRADRGLALRAFREATRSEPGFLLGYGHLFHVYLELARWIASGDCPGFERPRAERVLPWETRSATHQEFFCPSFSADSVTWWPWDAWPLRDRTRAAAVADTLMETVRREVLRWEVAAPDAPGAHDVWTSWWLTRRAGVPYPVDAARADGFAAEALAAAQRAALLRRDTTPDDLVRIGSLELAAGDAVAALSTTRRALDAPRPGAGTWVVPISAANAFLAAGEAEPAAAILQANWGRWFSFAVNDTVEDRSLHVREAPSRLARIHALAATGVTGPPLREAFEALDRTWTAHGLTSRQAVLLREWSTRFVAPALALDDEARRAWFRAWDSVPALWRAFDEVETDPSAAGAALEAHLARPGPAIDRPQSLFPAAVLAQRLDRHALAASLFERMDGAVLDVENVEPGWGLRALSLVLRARSYERMGDSTGAAAAYRRFLESRRGASDSPWSREAAASLARLERDAAM